MAKSKTMHLTKNKNSIQQYGIFIRLTEGGEAHKKTVDGNETI